MTEIKICGITSKRDALQAAEAGADALGFIFHPPSPRFVPPETVKAVIRALPPEVVTVGVFVDGDPREIETVVAFCGLDLVQLHGREPLSTIRHFQPERIIKAITGFSGESREKVEELSRFVRAFLVDAATADRPGGTGLRADWGLARDVARRHRLILAGGLSAENLAKAVEAVSPDAVDVNSGVEIAPGVKDPGKVRSAIALIKGRGEGSREKKIFVKP
ncbi:MAG TPA: phosphoribosylanthranilate isomerase [Syntrophales bacterium]|nr:phosphoribosylanthranilate isomerase [Syntrophales bacterium]